MHATRVSMPDVEGIDKDVASLKADLYKLRRASDVLTDSLEDPSANPARARLLGGKIPEKDELVAKLQVCLEGGLVLLQHMLCSRRVMCSHGQCVATSNAACGWHGALTSRTYAYLWSAELGRPSQHEEGLPTGQIHCSR